MVQFNKGPLDFYYFIEKYGSMVKLAITMPLQGIVPKSYFGGSTMEKNVFIKKVSKDCPYCGQHIEDSHSQYANHVRWCKKNPKREELDKSTKEKLKKSCTKEKGEFEVTCAKCGKIFKVLEPIDKFPKKEKYYCSRSCANSHIRTKESKQKTRDSINKYYHSNKFEYKKYKHICKNCNKEFENSNKNTKYCSNFCRIDYKQKNSKRTEFEKYKNKCAFTFSLKNYPEEFDFELIKQYGWYKAKNHGDNLTGVSRDHMVSVKYGFEHDIDPKIISHPANCQLMIHSENVRKYNRCSITLEELLVRIENWNKKYNINIGSSSLS